MPFKGSPGEGGETGGGNNARGLRVRGGIGGRGAKLSLTPARARRGREANAKIRRNKAINRF